MGEKLGLVVPRISEYTAHTYCQRLNKNSRVMEYPYTSTNADRKRAVNMHRQELIGQQIQPLDLYIHN